jgi:hypothetical protein
MKGEHISPKDEAILQEAESLLASESPSLSAYRELILEILRVLLDRQPVKKRIKLVLTPEQTTVLEGKLYDQIAAVVAKTYAELGDVAEVADDMALQLIRSLLLEYDRKIIDRNRFRRINWAKLRRAR